MAATVETPSYWQIKCSGVRQRTSQLYQLGQWTDCVFRVGAEAASVSAHKLVLAIASPVFEAMFYGALAHKDNAEPIDVPDMQVEAFNAFIQYIYTDEINITSCTVAYELYNIGQKYMLPKLQSESLQYLQKNLTPDNVGFTYEFAQLFDQELADQCLKVIKSNPLKVLQSDSFTKLQIDTVVKIFSLEPLNIESELDLYNAAVEYTSYSVKERESIFIKNAKLVGSSMNEDIKEPEDQEVIVANAAVQSNGAVYEGDGFNVNAVRHIQEELVKKHSAETSDLSVNENSTEATDTSDQSVKKTSTDTVEAACEGSVKNKATDDESKCDNAVENKGDPPELPIRKAVKHIRFLAMEPREFSENDFSLILSQSEILAIILNLTSKKTHTPMPVGFSTNRKSRIQIDEESDAEYKTTVFRTMVNHISRIGVNESPVHLVQNVSCYLKTEICNNEGQTNLGLYLCCIFEDVSIYQYRLQVTFRLLSNRVDTSPFCRNFEKLYYWPRGRKIGGFANFIPWAELKDPENGYVTHDSVTLEVEIRTTKIQ